MAGRRSTAAGTTYSVSVYADASGVPGDTAAPLCGAIDVTGTLDASNTSLSVTLPIACSLPAGHY